MTNRLIAISLLVLGVAFAQGTKPLNPNIPVTATALADVTVKELVDLLNKITAEERAEVYPLGKTPSENEVQGNITRKLHLRAGDIVVNFAGHIVGHHPSQQEICSGANLLGEAVKRFFGNKLGPTASPNQKMYAVGEFLWDHPAVNELYTTIGQCTSLQPWINKPATPLTKK